MVIDTIEIIFIHVSLSQFRKQDPQRERRGAKRKGQQWLGAYYEPHTLLHTLNVGAFFTLSLNLRRR